MNTSKIIAATLCGWFGCSAAFAAVPVVSNVTSQQRAGTELVDISYNVADADGDTLTGVAREVPLSGIAHLGEGSACDLRAGSSTVRQTR